MLTIRAKFDAAQTTPDNYRHWAMADGLSAAQQTNSGIRYILRNRSRYEAANNSYLAGLAKNLAGDAIGSGPTLQLNTDDSIGNNRTEAAWKNWSNEVRLSEKLRLARMAKLIDGECFFKLFTDYTLQSPIKLNFQVLPAEMITSPRKGLFDWGDGIEMDSNGRVIRYWQTQHHPSELWTEPVPVSPRDIIHYANRVRPGQIRGIPETVPALPLYAQLRRFTMATVAAAETAADFAALLESSLPPSDDDEDELAALTKIEIYQRMMTTLPRGYRMSQLKAEHPATTHEMFLRCLLQEIAACHQVPLYLVAGSAADLSYAGGRLDLQSYQRTIVTDRDEMRWVILESLLMAWLSEATLIPGLLPVTSMPYGDWPRDFFWPTFEHVDPLKEALAIKTNLANGTTTLADEWAKKNADWEKKLKQRAKELKLLRDLGLSDDDALPTRRTSDSRLIKAAISDQDDYLANYEGEE